MQDKSESSFGPIALLEHEYYCCIWKLVKSGKIENLEGKRGILGQLMLEHPRYQYFWEVPYAFAEIELQEAYKGEVINPDLHLTIEAIIHEQIENRDPPETFEAYKALLGIDIEAHEARHIIGRVFLEMLYEESQKAAKGQQPDENFYIDRVRYLTKHPNKVIKEQKRKL